MAYQIKLISSETVLSQVDLSDVFGFDLSGGKPNPPPRVVRVVTYTFRDDLWFPDAPDQEAMIAFDTPDQSVFDVIQAIRETLEAGDQEAAAELADEVQG